MNEEFVKYAESSKLFSASDRVLLALSGGIDSMVMLDLFRKAGYSIGIIHCNFGLRGKESDKDERFLRNLAGKASIPFYARRFNTKEWSAKNKISVQMAAREMRYSYFEEIRKSEKYFAVATAHHVNDSIETFIFNMTRGTGISGLKGIPPRSGKVVRPLLFATREQILYYAINKKIRWREDSSNRSNRYSRNLIRHKVMPILLKLNPNLFSSMASTMQRIESSENLLLKWIDNQKSQNIRTENNLVYIDLGWIKKFNEPVLIHFLIRDFGFTYDQSLRILSVIHKQPGNQFISPSHLLTVDRAFLLVEPLPGKDISTWEVYQGQEYLETGNGEVFSFSSGTKPADLKTSPDIALLDEACLQYPLVIRPPEEGDKFKPLGLKGTQKLSDFMINNKIPRNMKNHLKVFLSGGKIFWIAGYRMDDRFKVRENTKRVLRIQYFRNQRKNREL